MNSRMNSVVVGMVLLTAGCCHKAPRMNLTTYDECGQPQEQFTHFSQAVYRIIPGGPIEMVMETETPSSIDPAQSIRQVVYLKTFWYPQPGRTFVESTQMDATTIYAILTPPTGIRCDGSAMLTYKWNKKGEPIKAYIESGILTPKYRMGDAVEPFGPSRFTGTVTLYEDPGQVVKTLQNLETQFRDRMPPEKKTATADGIPSLEITASR
jgi:hypothetical protein